MAALEVLPEPQQSLCQTTLSMCAYAGTGDVLVVQQMLHICSKHYETDVCNNLFPYSCKISLRVVQMILQNGGRRKSMALLFSWMAWLLSTSFFINYRKIQEFM